MQMAREEAMLAKEALDRKNHILVQNHREEIKQQLEILEEEQEQVLEEKKELVSKVIDDRVRPREAEARHAEEKAQRAEEIRKEVQLELERKQREDAHEMER